VWHIPSSTDIKFHEHLKAECRGVEQNKKSQTLWRLLMAGSKSVMLSAQGCWLLLELPHSCFTMLTLWSFLILMVVNYLLITLSLGSSYRWRRNLVCFSKTTIYLWRRWEETVWGGETADWSHISTICRLERLPRWRRVTQGRENILQEQVCLSFYPLLGAAGFGSRCSSSCHWWSLSLSLSLSIFNGHFPGGPRLPDPRLLHSGFYWS